MPYKPYVNEATRGSILSAVADPENQAAWSRFFDRYAGFIFGVARSHGLPEEDAHEIVQTVMLELCTGETLAQYDRAKGRFRSWLNRRILWRIVDFHKSAARRRDMEVTLGSDLSAIPDDSAVLDRQVETEWMEAVTGEALRRLQAETKPNAYAVFHASMIDGLETPEIQRMYDVSADNIYQIRRRLGVRFRQLIEIAKQELDRPMLPEGRK